MSETPDPAPIESPIDAGTVKYLRLLVSVLSVTMIIGFIVIVALFVIRFSGSSEPDLPAEITLPDGTTPMAFTKGRGWYAVVTEDDQILIFDSTSGNLRQTITVNP